MSFGAPWMLLGTLAALIPLLVHLFDRRRPRQHPFAAISFVLRSQKRTARRLKLKRLLLYVLRTLILLAIPLALARPMWSQDAAAAAATRRGPAATAIVLDTSLSMRFDVRGETNFARGQDEARDALADLLAEEPANLVLCGPSPSPPGPPGFERGAIRSAIDGAKPTFGHADLHRCLELAAASLEESPIAAKRIIVVSDLMAHGVRADAPAPTVKGPDGAPVRPEIVLRDVAREADDSRVLPNRAVVALSIEPALQVGPRAYQFTFTVRNFGAEPVSDVEASLKIGGSIVAKSFLEIPAGGTAQKALSHRFDSGGTFVGEVRLTADSLEADDVWPFVVQVPRPLEALVINGAPSAQRYRDEVFFLEPALTAPGSPVQASVRDPEAGLKEDFSKYDVLILANVSAPDAETARRLQTFVDGGGGLFLALGDRTEPAAWNERMGALLPRPFRDVKTWAERDAATGELAPDGRPGAFQDVDTSHPLLSPFVGEAAEGLLSARVWRHMLLEPEGGNPQTRVLATFEDGTPALVVARVGKGRVALFTSTLDRDWSDLAIRTGFLPLMQRAAAYLAGALEEREELRARIGTSLTLRPPGGVKVASVEGPSDARIAVQGLEDGSLSVGPFSEPGIYAVKDVEGKPIPSLAFSVVLEGAESDLTRAPAESLATAFGEETVQAAAAEGQAPKVPLWTWLIVAAAVAFFGEGLLLRKT